MQQHEFSSELLVFRNATKLKSGDSATEREWGVGPHVNVNSLRPSELIESGGKVKRRKVKGRLWGDQLQWFHKDTVS
jgi:hypothetical protein